MTRSILAAAALVAIVLALAVPSCASPDPSASRPAPSGAAGTPGPPASATDDPDTRWAGQDDPRVAEAMRHARQGRFAEAAERLGTVLDERPDDLAILLMTGAAEARAGRLDDARTRYRRAVELEPEHPGALRDLGLVETARVDDAAAIAAFRSAVEANPQRVDVRLELGRALQRAGRIDDAVLALEGAVEREPRMRDAHVALAFARIEAGRWRDAVDGLDAAVSRFPTDPLLGTMYARVLATAPDAELRDPALALRMAENLARNRPGTGTSRTVAMALAANERFDDAVEAQRRLTDVVGRRADRDPDGERLLGALRDDLDRYRRELPCVRPYEAGHPGFRPPRPYASGRDRSTQAPEAP